MENSSSAWEIREFVSNADVEIVAEKVVTIMPLVVSSLGYVVQKRRADKFRLARG
jgi:hypothetical protein